MNDHPLKYFVMATVYITITKLIRQFDYVITTTYKATVWRKKVIKTTNKEEEGRIRRTQEEQKRRFIDQYLYLRNKLFQMYFDRSYTWYY